MAAAIFLAIGDVGPGATSATQAFTVESITINTNIVRGKTSRNEALRIKGALYMPRSKDAVPAIVIVPSSGGVEEEREIYYAERLAGSGIGALVLDSFGSRGISNSLYDQSLLESWDIENDAIAALQRLMQDPRIKSDRIGILGVSKGGTVAMDAALTVRRKWMNVEKIAFAAHIAISPDCTWLTRSTATTGAPILFMLAELDDQTPARACVDQATRLRQSGNQRVEVHIYKGAHHAWEELGSSPHYDPKVENYSRCRVWIEDDGRMTAAETGKLVPERQWRRWAMKNCMTLGATCCGGSKELKDRATGDLIAFLRKHRF